MCDGRVVVCFGDYAEKEMGWEMGSGIPPREERGGMVISRSLFEGRRGTEIEFLRNG